MSKPSKPPGGYEATLTGLAHDDEVRLALTVVMDTAELVTRWFVDHGIKPKAEAVARLTELALQRAGTTRGGAGMNEASIRVIAGEGIKAGMAVSISNDELLRERAYRCVPDKPPAFVAPTDLKPGDTVAFVPATGEVREVTRGRKDR